MGITKFPNQQGITINIIKNYGQIDEPMLKALCDEFCKATGAKFETRATQNNHRSIKSGAPSLRTRISSLQ